MKRVGLIDYGMGNILSVARAFERFGVQTELVESFSDRSEYDYLVLPGVGAFGKAMENLNAQKSLITGIKRHIVAQRPFLGICLGMQLLVDESEEFGQHQGLGLIPGKVTAIPKTKSDGTTHKIPHIGWNTLIPTHEENAPAQSLLSGLTSPAWVYFVHSFSVTTENPTDTQAYSDYNGRKITAVISRDHIHGCQFHPEKSGPEGLRILSNFLDL